MKNPSRLFMAAAALTLFASAGQIQAESTLVGGDGITASPKVRQMLNERPRAVPAQQVAAQRVTTYMVPPQTTIAASPKVSQMRNEMPRTYVSEVRMETVGYKATSSDGITASPKARQMLDERRLTVEIAPLK